MNSGEDARRAGKVPELSWGRVGAWETKARRERRRKGTRGWRQATGNGGGGAEGGGGGACEQ